MPVEYTENYERRRIVHPSFCIPNSFRTQDIGRKGYSKRIACKSIKNGKWITQSILIANNETTFRKTKLRNQAKQMIRNARKKGYFN